MSAFRPRLEPNPEIEDVRLINETGNAVLEVRNHLYARLASTPGMSQMLPGQYNELVEKLDGALSALRLLRQREQAEAEGRAP